MEVQQLMACPVCTLYLREGMSMQSHLNTHPKDQVIEALVRLYTTERNVPSSYSQQPSPILNPFMMVSEEQVIMGRQQVTSILHPQVMSYPIYQQQHFLSTNTDYLNDQSDCNRTQDIQPIVTSADNTGTVTTIINVSDHSEYSEREIGTMVGDGVIISSGSSTHIEKTVGRTEVYIVEPAEQNSHHSSSNQSAIMIRNEYHETDKTDQLESTICDQYITSDCDYQDEDARHSEDILNMENEDPIACGDQAEELSSHNTNAHSCSGLNIQADERMPARGELSGQESLGNTNSSVWIPEIRPEDAPVAVGGWGEKQRDYICSEDGSGAEQRKYQCLYCNEMFTCPKERRVHISSLHSSPSTQQGPDIGQGKVDAGADCAEERKDQALVVSLPKQEAGLTRVAVCVKCGLQMATPKDLKDHVAKEHKKVPIRKCTVCLEIFPTKEGYKEHLVKVHPLECTTCGKTFHTKSGLTMHVKIHLKVKPHPCTVCTKSFVTSQKLREHMNSHTGVAPIQCNMCDRKFKRYSNLKQHKDVVHFKVKKKLKAFFCECGQAFTSKKKLAWHEETHSEKPKQCMYCSERYIHNSSLTRHIRRSHDENYLPPGEGTKPRNVECPMCAQVCVESAIRTHMKQHSTPKQFACVICGKKFRTKWNLHLHRWTHASRVSKPYKCNQCKGAFVRLSDFQAHIRSHFGQKPFTCNHCGMQFNRKQNWQRHEKEHNGQKRFACTDCGKSFHRSYYLIEHVRIHTGVKPYSCHICNKTTTTKSNHNKHLRTHHARETVNTEG